MTLPEMNLHSDDLVRLPSGMLAFIERIPGNLSDTESDDSTSDTDTYTDESLTDSYGRIANWLPPPRSVPTAGAALDPTSNNLPLISTYEDPSGTAVDAHEYELRRDVTSAGNDHHQPKISLPPGSAVVSHAFTSIRAAYPTSKLKLLDRSFEPGTLVMRTDVSVNNAQCALVESVHKTLLVRRIIDIVPTSLYEPDPSTVFEVPAEDLNFFCDLRAGDVVVRRNWVGVVNHFQENVSVKFSDGSLACVQGHSRTLFNTDPRTPDRSGHDHSCEGFYPGQRVRSLPQVLRLAKWLRGSYSGINEGIVESVSIGEIGVEWLAKSLFADSDSESLMSPNNAPGRELVTRSQLTSLECFRPTWWSVGDRGFLGHDNGTTHSQSGRAAEADVDVANNGTDEVDGEWEEDLSNVMVEVPSQSITEIGDTSHRTTRHRPKRLAGRLSQAHRRLRERNRTAEDAPNKNQCDSQNAPIMPQDVVQVVGTATKIDVLWQDGSRECGVSCLQFRQQIHPDPYDYGPHELVRLVGNNQDFSRAPDTNLHNPKQCLIENFSNEKVGYVVRTYQDRRTALVHWNDSKEGSEEEVSVYDLKGPNFDARIGDTVLRIPTEPSYTRDERKDFIGVLMGQKEGKYTVLWHGGTKSDVDLTEIVTFIPEGESDDEEDESDSDDGEIDVTRPPSDAMATERNNSVSSLGDSDEKVDNEAAARRDLIRNWGTVLVSSGGDEDVVGAMEAARRQIDGCFTNISTESECADVCSIGKDLLEKSVQHGVDTVKDSVIAGAKALAAKGTTELPSSFGQTAAYLFVSAVVQYVVTNNISNGIVPPTSLFPSSRRDELFRRVGQFAFGDLRQEAEVIMIRKVEKIMHEACEQSGCNCSGVNKTIPPSSDSRGRTDVYSDMDNNIDGVSSDESMGKIKENSSSSVQQFEVVEDLQNFIACWDGSIDSIDTTSGLVVGGSFVRVVNREWQRLRRSLPEGIYVQASEKQQDRLRAFIIGPLGTPYEDVLFVFDILMSDEYPLQPPYVRFHSYGRRLNPNLYEDGKVCLSILGTWDGNGVENWDAKNSNLLRVLVSLQALVFVDEPYYNEAGYQKQRGTVEGQINSRTYSETALLLSLRHIISSLANSETLPKESASIFKKHYLENGAAQRIIQRCRRLASEGLEQQREKLNEGGNKSEITPTGRIDHINKAPPSLGLCRSITSMVTQLEKVFERFGGRDSG